MSLSKSNKSLLKNAIRECVLLEANNKIQKDISSVVNLLKEILKSKNISCRINFLQPDNDKKYQDFGSLTVSIDVSVGRPKNMSINSISSYIKRLSEKIGLIKYFSFVGPGLSGNVLDLEFELKTKYVKYYISNSEEYPVDTSRFEGDRYYLPRDMKLI